MSSVGLFLYLLTEGFVPYIEDKLVQGWNNNSFIGGAHVGEDSPQIQEIFPLEAKQSGWSEQQLFFLKKIFAESALDSLEH